MRMKQKKSLRSRGRQRRSLTPTKRTGDMRRTEQLEYPEREVIHSFNSETMLQREIMSFKSREEGRLVKMVRRVVDRHDEYIEPPSQRIVSRNLTPDTMRRSPEARKNSRERFRYRSPQLRRRSPEPRQVPSSFSHRSPDARARSPGVRHIPTSHRQRSPDGRRRSPDFRHAATSLRARSPDSRRRGQEPRRRSSPNFIEMSSPPRICPIPRRNSPVTRKRSPEFRRMSPTMRPRDFDIGQPLERSMHVPRDIRYTELEHRKFMEPMMLVRRVIEPEMPYGFDNRSIPVARGNAPPGYEWERVGHSSRSSIDDLVRCDLPSISHICRDNIGRIRYSPQPRSPPRNARSISSYVEERPAKVNKLEREKSLSPKIPPKLNDMDVLTKVIYDESQPTMLPPPSVRKAIIMRNQPNKPKAYRSKPYTANDSKQSGIGSKNSDYNGFPLDKKRGPDVRLKAKDIRAPVSSRVVRPRSPPATRPSFSPPRRMRVMEDMEVRRGPPADYNRGFPISPYGTVGPRRTPPRHRSPSPLHGRERKRSWAELSPSHPVKRRAPEVYHAKPERSMAERRRGADYDREKGLRNHQMDFDEYPPRAMKREWSEGAVHRRRRSFD